MKILIRESQAIVELLSDLGQDRIGLFLASGNLPQIHEFSSLNNPSPVIAVQFVTWLEANAARLSEAFSALIKFFPNSPCYQVFVAGLGRLAHWGGSGAIHPWDERLVRGVPMVNRSALRHHLKGLASGNSLSPVMMINGPSGTGRSHSWYLIRYVADQIKVRAASLDIESLAVHKRTLEGFFEAFTRKAGLSNVSMPSSAAQAAESVGSLFAEKFCEEWECQRKDPVWVVVDGLDRSVAPEIRSFLCHLSAMILRMEADKIVLFLLGADGEFGINDRARRPKVEIIGSFEVDEVGVAAASVNSWGTNSLDSTTLGLRVSVMVECLAESDNPRTACEAVHRLLVDLREEVSGQ
jgi:hypothetical protein